MKISKTTLFPALALCALAACSKADADGPAKAGEPAAKAVAAPAPAPAPAPDKALTLDDVLAKHHEALGGVAVLRATKSISYKASETRDDGTTATKTIHRARPGLLRVEFKDGDKVGVKAFDGQKGWIHKDGKAEIMADDKVAGMKAYAQFDDALLDPAAMGAKVALVGSENLPEGKAHKLTVTNADGSVETRFIDAATNLEVKRIVAYEHDGKKGEKVITFGDYKNVGGQVINHSMTWASDGKSGKTVFSDFQIDQPMAATLFAVPAGAVPMVAAPAMDKKK